MENIVPNTTSNLDNVQAREANGISGGIAKHALVIGSLASITGTLMLMLPPMQPLYIPSLVCIVLGAGASTIALIDLTIMTQQNQRRNDNDNAISSSEQLENGQNLTELTRVPQRASAQSNNREQRSNAVAQSRSMSI